MLSSTSLCCIFCCLILTGLSSYPSVVVYSFVVKSSGGDIIRGATRQQQSAAEALAMVFPSTSVVARTVGRRSKRLTTSMLKTSAIPVTPSPKKNVSTGRKRKTTKSTSKAPASKRTLQLTDTIPTTTPSSIVNPISNSNNSNNDNTKNQVENNDLVLTTDMVAAINPTQEFIDLNVPPEELRPSNTLTTGQCFHWKVVYPTTTINNASMPISAWGTHDATEWVGTLRLRLFDSTESIIIVIRETPTTTLYRSLTTIPSSNNNNNEEELRRALLDYFQLETSLPKLYEEWSLNCPRLAVIAKCIPGVRIIKQDPWECLVSFICSSNNNIPRIHKMLANIRKEYGRPLLTIPTIDIDYDGNDDQSITTTLQQYYQFYSFPSLEELFSQATEKDLRSKCGMGYRADYIIETMKILLQRNGDDDNDDKSNQRGEIYLRDVLSNIKDPTELQTKLCEFKGVGRKVADCVALFSLRGDECIPVDTHVWNIAIRDYDTDGILKTNVKSLTPTNYKLVGDIFRKRFPNRAGWAHSLLFVAELPSFRGLLPTYITKEMDDFRNEEKERKKKQKDKDKI
jgi:N-glycosylase/DNA lyase